MVNQERVADHRKVPEGRAYRIAEIIHHKKGMKLVESGLKLYIGYAEIISKEFSIPKDPFSVTIAPKETKPDLTGQICSPPYLVEGKDRYTFFKRPLKRDTLNPVEEAVIKTNLKLCSIYSAFCEKIETKDIFSILTKQHPTYFATLQVKTIYLLLQETQGSYFDSLWQLMMNCDTPETQCFLVRNFVTKPKIPHPTAPSRVASLSPAEQCAGFSNGFWGNITSKQLLLNLPEQIKKQPNESIQLPRSFFEILVNYEPSMFHGGCPFSGEEIMSDFYTKMILPEFEKQYTLPRISG